jgi:hypothetical protein
MKLTRGTTFLLGLILTGATLLGACSPEEPVLPTLARDTSIPEAPPIETPRDDLEAAAKALHDCLTDENLPATYATAPDGRSTLIRFDESIPAYWVSPSGDTERTGALSDSQEEEALDLRRARAAQAPENGSTTWPANVFLYINGVDRTETWAMCLERSGYDDAAVWDSVDTDALDARWEQMVVEASNEWARCARDHGVSGVIDAQPATNENETAEVLLPLTTTEAELEALIVECPLFDPEIEEENDRIIRQAISDGQPYEDIIDQMNAQPSVSIDGSSLTPGAGTDSDQWDHYDRLMKILGYEAIYSGG